MKLIRGDRQVGSAFVDKKRTMATTTSSQSETVDFILPDLGEGVHEAELISWKVSVGQTIDEMDVLAEMETDKALVEVPSPYAGTIVALHGAEGETVHVGNPIVSFENATQGGDVVASGGPSKAAMVEAGDTAALAAEPKTAPKADEKSADAGTVVGTMETQPTLGTGQAGKAMATPAVRRLAKELGVNIDGISGSGRGGRVTASDVQGAAGASTGAIATPSTRAATAPLSAPTYAPVQVDASGTSERIAFKGVRKKIADALDRSVKTAVHFAVMDTADVTALDQLRRQQAAASGEKVSFLPFVIQAVCRALRKFPQINAVVDDAAAEILIKGVINMGIAVDTEHGLMVPNVENADRLPILPLGRAVSALAEQCRNRTIPLERLKGGTFTISNVGSYGGAFATPILNYPEVGILGVGRARDAVLTKDGAIYVGKQMPLSVSCDHRVVDGVYAAKLLGEVIQLLENPEILLQPAG